MPLRTITVLELKNLLDDFEDDQPIAFSSDYGDRSHTEQVLPIEGYAEEKKVVKSGYSESGYAVAGDDDLDPELEETRTILHRRTL